MIESSYLCVSLVLVPDEAQLGVHGHGVVCPDVAVEQGTFDLDRLTGQNMVLLQIHRPVYASVHCENREKNQKNIESVLTDGQFTFVDSHSTLQIQPCF